MLEEGTLRDGAGRSISFRNATVIFTHTTPLSSGGQQQQQQQQQPGAAAVRGGRQQQVAQQTAGSQRGLHSGSGAGAGHQGHLAQGDGSASGAASGLALAAGMQLSDQQQIGPSPSPSPSPSVRLTSGGGGGYYSESPAAAAQLLHELLTRVGAVVQFAPLAAAHLHQILDLHLGPAAEVAASMGSELVVAPELRGWLVRRALEARAGARPLQQLVRQHVVLPLADRLLEEDVMLQEGSGSWGGGAGRQGSGGRVLATLVSEVPGGAPVPSIVML
jgi:hypothetical protein